MPCIYLHYESAEPSYTLKCAVGGAPLTVRDALNRFAAAYGGTGHELSGLTLVDEGEKLGRERSVTEALWSLGEAGSDDVNVLETPDTVLYKCVALFSREAENEEDLEFHKGAVIECLQEDVPGWVRNKHTH